MAQSVKVTIEAEVDPDRETIDIKPFGSVLAEENQMFARADGREPKQTYTTSLSGTGREGSPDDDDTDFD
jgi:hypothetical protein